MTKKNKLTILLALMLVAVLAVGATLAFFTDEDAATNTFVLGKVGIDLQEMNGETDTDWGDGPLDFTNLVPLDVAPKMAQVVVDEDSEDCYIRVTVELMAKEGDEDNFLTDDDQALVLAAVKAAIEEKDTEGLWTVAADGNVITLTTKELAKKEDVLPLFDEIEIPNLGNTAAGKSFALDLNAYAIQAKNVTLADIKWDNIDFETGLEKEEPASTAE